MPSNYFQFKKFIVKQDKCSMKVCTDSCVFGAWVANKIESKFINPKKILDIGTGTGLLSLMLAQKSPATIDAVEIDAKAFTQASENVIASPWNEHLKVFNSDIKNWNAEKKYDLIICNPPFYENDLKPADINKNVAKHDEGLKLVDLINIVQKNLNPKSHFALLLPYHRISYFENIALENNFYLFEKLLIKQTPSHQYFRGVLLFSNEKINATTKELIIKGEKGNYTESFTKLLQDYYLVL